MTSLMQKLITRAKIHFYEGAVLESVDGIKVCALGGLENNLSFLACALDALDLIEQQSPRHYRRIRKHLSYIVDTELLSTAEYEGASHACRVDFTRMNHPLHAEWMCWCFAGILVHEATHGLISDRGINYSRTNHVRIEKICCAEENRFLHHAPEDVRHQLIRPFREVHWSHLWNQSRWQRCWNLLKRQRIGKDFINN